ncbi:MAG TPA: GNAT family N-acetyltransferase [Actinomycetota bacterium]
MADLEPLLRFWRALDARFERVTSVPWGAVVTDARFPAIWDVNYARVESRSALTLAELEAELRPAIAEAGARHLHTVLFHPEEHTSLITEVSTRGDRLSWDAVMELRSWPASSLPPGPQVEEIRRLDQRFWQDLARSLREFDVTEPAAEDQILRIEREVVLPAGKRWFGVRDGAGHLAFGSLTVLEGVGSIDHVVTFPEVRRRGYATAIVGRIVNEARSAGARRVTLLAEPGGQAQRLYERLGFATITQIASTLGSVEAPNG